MNCGRNITTAIFLRYTTRKEATGKKKKTSLVETMRAYKKELPKIAKV